MLAPCSTSTVALWRTLTCVLTLALFAQVGGVSRVVGMFTGGASVDLCTSGCEDQDDSAPCSPACPTCSCAPLARTMTQPPAMVRLGDVTHDTSGPIAGRLLGAPEHVDGDGVFHPPRV